MWGTLVRTQMICSGCRIPMGRQISSRDLREKAREGLGQTLGSLVLGMLVLKALGHQAVDHLQCLLDDRSPVNLRL